MPVIAEGSATYREAVAEKARLAKVLETEADPKAMAVMLYRLQGHYWQAGMSEALAAEVSKDYLRLLGGYPETVWRCVCDAMLLDKERKFFPKVGELKHMLDNVLASDRWRLKKLIRLIESATSTPSSHHEAA